MSIRAYILVEAAVGKAKAVVEGIGGLIRLEGAEIKSVDGVTGPFDAIALIEAGSLDQLGAAITEGFHKIDGVCRTTTCLVAKIG